MEMVSVAAGATKETRRVGTVDGGKRADRTQPFDMGPQ